MIAWPAKLVEDIAARRAVLFFGSGISSNSTSSSGKRPPTWGKFLDDLRETAKVSGLLTPGDNKTLRQLMAERDYLSVCDVLKRILGREDFVARIKNEFKTPGYQPAEIHKAMNRLDLRVVATPNFDEIYETYVQGVTNGTCSVKLHSDSDIAECLRGNDRVILKIHGTVSDANELIFTRSDYAEARYKYRAFYSLIESLIRTHTFLFIGCGLSDPDIRLLLEDYSYSFAQSRRHYFTIAAGTLGKVSSAVLGEALNLSFLEYNSKDNHAELSLSLPQLADVVERDRQRLADGQLW